MVVAIVVVAFLEGGEFDIECVAGDQLQAVVYFFRAGVEFAVLALDEGFEPGGFALGLFHFPGEGFVGGGEVLYALGPGGAFAGAGVRCRVRFLALRAVACVLCEGLCIRRFLSAGLRGRWPALRRSGWRSW